MASSPNAPSDLIPTELDQAGALSGSTVTRSDPVSQRATPGKPVEMTPLSASVGRDYAEDSTMSGAQLRAPNGDAFRLGREDSAASTGSIRPRSRTGTLQKKSSLSRKSSLKRADSRKSTATTDVKSSILGHNEKFIVGDENDMNSAYYTPVPTSGTPTEVLANRFQAWRKVLKDLIAYYREIQVSYEHRSKSIAKVSGIIGNTVVPATFIPEGSGGIADAPHLLRDLHKQSIAESNKAKEIEEDVILSLTGLRSDLLLKIKEIRGLASDFKNSVEREMDATRRAIHGLRDTLNVIDSDPRPATGKSDAFLVKLAVERQLERQIEEENYLHRAYLNLEGSGRELESIVVGEIQKSYNALVGILRREADQAHHVIERLRTGPLAMSRDHEWSVFVENDPRFVDPRIPPRDVRNIQYPGQHHPAATEVRSGMLERKSKYLKSYTAGWYVLSSTHLHEFRSPDRIHLQTPGMSLYLLDQKLGSHSQPGSSSHKFILKGRQTGAMHRGHSWVFRAESHETMLAWYEDIKNLTEKTGEERNAFVRQHARSVSGVSQAAVSVDSDGAMDEDEADRVPYSGNPSPPTSVAGPGQQDLVRRPQPGGRFPSDVQLGQGSRTAPSSSSASFDHERHVVAAAGSTSGTPLESTALATPGARDAERSSSGAAAVGHGPPSISSSSPPPPGTILDSSRSDQQVWLREDVAPHPAAVSALPPQHRMHESTVVDHTGPVVTVLMERERREPESAVADDPSKMLSSTDQGMKSTSQTAHDPIEPTAVGVVQGDDRSAPRTTKQEVAVVPSVLVSEGSASITGKQERTTSSAAASQEASSPDMIKPETITSPDVSQEVAGSSITKREGTATIPNVAPGAPESSYTRQGGTMFSPAAAGSASAGDPWAHQESTEGSHLGSVQPSGEDQASSTLGSVIEGTIHTEEHQKEVTAPLTSSDAGDVGEGPSSQLAGGTTHYAAEQNPASSAVEKTSSVGKDGSTGLPVAAEKLDVDTKDTEMVRSADKEEMVKPALKERLSSDYTINLPVITASEGGKKPPTHAAVSKTLEDGEEEVIVQTTMKATVITRQVVEVQSDANAQS